MNKYSVTPTNSQRNYARMLWSEVGEGIEQAGWGGVESRGHRLEGVHKFYDFFFTTQHTKA